MPNDQLNITAVERDSALNINQNTSEVYLNVVNTPIIRELNVTNSLCDTSSHQVILGSGFSFEIELIDIPITFSALHFYKPTGENVSVAYRKASKIYIDSNINLLNHIVIFN